MLSDTAQRASEMPHSGPLRKLYCLHPFLPPRYTSSSNADPALTPFPPKARAAATAFNTLMDRVAADADYLEATLKAAAEYDDFTVCKLVTYARVGLFLWMCAGIASPLAVTSCCMP